MKLDELKNAYTPVPTGFHEALQAAVSDVKEEQKVKKLRVGLLAAALLVAALCGTAIALISYYSVRDYQAEGKPSEAFEKLIGEIGQTYENDYVTLTIGDAIFDGKSVALTMNLYSKDVSNPVFLYPKLVGYCGDRKLDIDVEGMRGLDQSGFLYPNLIDGDVLDHQYGMDAALYEDTADSDITWTFTMDVLAPNWPIQCYDVELHGDESDPSMEDYMQPFCDAYADKRILATWGESLVEYEAILPAPDGMTDEAWNQLRFPDRLVQSGAFTRIDTFTCTFVTKLPEIAALPGQTIPLSDYTVALDALSISAMRVDFTLRQLYPAKTEMPDSVYYELRDQDGEALGDLSGYGVLSEDGMCFTYHGTVKPTRDDLASLTFVPYTNEQTEAGDEEKRYDEAHAFTVEIKQ